MLDLEDHVPTSSLVLPALDDSEEALDEDEEEEEAPVEDEDSCASTFNVKSESAVKSNQFVSQIIVVITCMFTPCEVRSNRFLYNNNWQRV